jgi:hypothetical protein
LQTMARTWARVARRGGRGEWKSSRAEWWRRARRRRCLPERAVFARGLSRPRNGPGLVCRWRVASAVRKHHRRWLASRSQMCPVGPTERMQVRPCRACHDHGGEVARSAALRLAAAEEHRRRRLAHAPLPQVQSQLQPAQLQLAKRRHLLQQRLSRHRGERAAAGAAWSPCASASAAPCARQDLLWRQSLAQRGKDGGG